MIVRKPLYALGVFLIFLGFGCQDSNVSNSLVTSEAFRKLPKIDVHAHYKYPRTYLPDFFERWNIKPCSVDVAIEKETVVNNFKN